jgi:hypothetical protein
MPRQTRPKTRAQHLTYMVSYYYIISDTEDCRFYAARHNTVDNVWPGRVIRFADKLRDDSKHYWLSLRQKSPTRKFTSTHTHTQTLFKVCGGIYREGVMVLNGTSAQTCHIVPECLLLLFIYFCSSSCIFGSYVRLQINNWFKVTTDIINVLNCFGCLSGRRLHVCFKVTSSKHQA